MLRHSGYVAIMFAIGGLAAGQVWLSHLRVNTAQDAASLKKEKVILEQEVQGLKLELASLTRPDTLRRLAREKLGMHAPTPMQVMKP